MNLTRLQRAILFIVLIVITFVAVAFEIKLLFAFVEKPQDYDLPKILPLILSSSLLGLFGYLCYRLCEVTFLDSKPLSATLVRDYFIKRDDVISRVTECNANTLNNLYHEFAQSVLGFTIAYLNAGSGTCTTK